MKVEIPKCILQADSNPSIVRFSSDGNLFAIGTYTGKISLWDLNQLKKIWTVSSSKQEMEIVALSFDPENNFLCACDHHGEMNAFNLKEKKALPSKNTNSKYKIIDLVYNLNGELLIALKEKESSNIVLKSSKKENKLFTFKCESEQTAKLSPNGEIIATAGASDNILKIWDCKTGSQIAELPWDGAGNPLIGGIVGISSDCNYIVYKLGKWRQLSLFDIKSGREIRKLLLGEGELFELCFSKDNRFLIASNLGELVLWDIHALVNKPRNDECSEYIYQWGFTPGNRACADFCINKPYLALGWGYFGGGPQLEIWDISSIIDKQSKYWFDSSILSEGESFLIPAAHWTPPGHLQGTDFPIISLPYLSGDSAPIKHGRVFN